MPRSVLAKRVPAEQLEIYTHIRQAAPPLHSFGGINYEICQLTRRLVSHSFIHGNEWVSMWKCGEIICFQSEMQKHPQSFANLYKYVGRDSVMKSIRIQTDNQLQYRLYCTMLPKCRGLRSCSSWFSWSFLRSSNNSCPRNRIERTLANAIRC